MNFKKTKLVYFSPTGTGKKIVNEIARGVGKDTEIIDLTHPLTNTNNFRVGGDELTIFATPVYGGRVPALALERLQRVKGDSTPAVIVSMYGNRAYGNALFQLRVTISDLGFKPIAGAAFIGQHSFHSEETPIAKGRPDREDLKKAYEFGKKILEKINNMKEIKEVTVPGTYPETRSRRSTRAPRSPVTSDDLCILCGMCAMVCPTGCVTVSDNVETSKEDCIACSACVQSCPTGARYWENEGILGLAKRLSAESRKEPEVFL